MAEPDRGDAGSNRQETAWRRGGLEAEEFGTRDGGPLTDVSPENDGCGKLSTVAASAVDHTREGTGEALEVL